MVVERRLLRNSDWLLLGLACLLVGYGLIAIFSATQSDERLTGGDPFYFVKKQLLWFFLGLVVLGVTVLIDYHSLKNYAREIYLGNLILLVLVLFLGREGGGAQRWMGIGAFRLQPSEIAKVATIITMAAYLSRNRATISHLPTVFKSFLYLSAPMLLVLLEPDLGTSLTFIFFWLGMLWIAQARALHLLLIILLGLLGFAAMWHFDILKDYQKDRILIMRNPTADRRGKGYQLIQQKIAVGSGQLTGKGITQGTQSQHHFIPEQHTDAIFSVIGEETGFLGSSILLLLFAALVVWRILNVALLAQDDFGLFIATGFASMFACHIFINVGMVLGIMPVTGLPLPFVSYGGSNLLTNMIAIGLLLNICMRRHKLQFGS
jgi:rod shape determining protein RodA